MVTRKQQADLGVCSQEGGGISLKNEGICRSLRKSLQKQIPGIIT